MVFAILNADFNFNNIKTKAGNALEALPLKAKKYSEKMKIYCLIYTHDTSYQWISILYFGVESLLNLLEEIELEYLEKAIKQISKQAQVDPRKIVVMGASRNAELALILASSFPKIISGVVA